jgi:hypothetical protein
VLAVRQRPASGPDPPGAPLTSAVWQAYKPGCPTPLIEESQKLKVASLLADQGHRVTIADRGEVLDQVRQAYGRRFDYSEYREVS